MADLKNLEKLPPDVQKRFAPFFEKLYALHGSKIVSVFIYGSATGQTYIPKLSDINSVFVFDSLDFSVFQKSLKVIAEGMKKKIIAPLFLTREYIESSLDVFPVEFLDMQENHVLVYGDDILSMLDIKGEHLRLFCEQQIKGKLIRIRQAYLEVGLKKKGIEALLKESLSALIPIFRNLIRLREQEPSVKKEEVITQLCDEFGLDKNVFLPVYKDARNDEKIGGQDVVVFVEKYINELQKLAQAVDQL